MTLASEEARSPHHDAARSRIRLVLAGERSKLRRLEVAPGAALGTGGAERRGRDADEDLGARRGRAGDILLPVVKVDGAYPSGSQTAPW